MMSVSGKVAVITGGAQGIGRALSESLLKKGAQVCIGDVDVAKGEETARELSKRFGDGRVIFVKCDVTSEAEFEDVFRRSKAEFGRIDIVCNNAGLANERTPKLMISVNVIGCIQGTLLAIEYMRRDKGGHGGVILNMSSMAALVTSHLMPGYIASKAAILAYTQSWAKNPENEKTGIRFCALLPASVNTDFRLNAMNMSYDPEMCRQRNPDDIMEPEAVAEAFMELVEKEKNNAACLTISQNGGKKYL